MNKKISQKDKIKKKPIYRVLEKNDLLKIRPLMSQIKPSIAGLQSNAIYSAICRDALIDERLIFVVAEKDQDLVGFTISIIDRKKFWKSFSFRHPILALKIGVKRLDGLLKTVFIKVRSKEKKIQPEHHDLIKKWLNSASYCSSEEYKSNQIAHTQYTAVRKEHRGESIGISLHNHRDRILANRGIKRIRATVQAHNLSAIMMNYRRGGYHIQQKGKCLFLTRDLS